MSSQAEPPPRRPPLTSPTLHVQVPSSDPTPLAEYDEKADPHMHLQAEPGSLSPPGSREQASRLNDDLELLRVERIVSRQENDTSRRSRSRNRSEGSRMEDTFNTTGQAAQVLPSQTKSTWLTRLWVVIKKAPRVLRYIIYAIPPGILILIPIFLDLFCYHGQKPLGGEGGVKLLWFGIWLEVVFLTIWASRITTAIMPWAFACVADALGSSNHKKWKDIGRQLEFPTALFLWQLAVLISYSPILNGHRDLPPNFGPDKHLPEIYWIQVVYKIIIAFFVLATLNFAEKILIQWIAGSFHLRTYSHRIRENQAQVGFLVALYSYAKTRLEAQDPVWGWTGSAVGLSSGSRTPMQTIQNNARQAWSKVGDAATRMAGDFTGRRILKGNHPRKVVMELLRNTPASYTLARVFFRTFVSHEKSSITVQDFYPAFPTQEEAEACFGVFDKDLNGDVSMEELEMVCNEIHLEKKAIAASLRDLDSVIKKLDNVFMFIIIIIVIIVFISIISNSAAAALTSTGSVILGLSWLLQATAQEFLQSIIFVFVKHPFDVGDRVTVYASTGSLMRGDDYYVLEISLLYTEFKKMEGHVVQAPNSLLNGIFILNQRRSQGLADPVSLTMRFGTTEAQIEELKSRMTQFCLVHKRDYASNILSEVKSIDEVYSITMNIIFFHKSNYQNELLRLTRRNKFTVELMRNMHDMGLEGPRVVQPGGMREMPLYWSHVQPSSSASASASEYNDRDDGAGTPMSTVNTPSAIPIPTTATPSRAPSTGTPYGQRKRSGTMAAVVEAGIDFQDVYNDRRRDGESTGGPSRLRSIGHSPISEMPESHGGLQENMLETMSSRGSGRSGSVRNRPTMWNRQSRTNTLRQAGGAV